MFLGFAKNANKIKKQLTRISHQAALDTDKALVLWKNLDDQKYSVWFKRAYHGSGWSSPAPVILVRNAG
jgi:hypothetical protein